MLTGPPPKFHGTRDILLVGTWYGLEARSTRVGQKVWGIGER